MGNTNALNSKMNSLPIRLIVCGTDTDVGKTIVSSLLVQGLKAIYWKPIQSGLDEGGDTGRVSKLLNLSNNQCLPELYKFKAAVSPHWAAEKENKFVDPKNLLLPSISKPLVIETAGGIMVPLNRKWLQIDLLKAWMQPVILVARSGLGTLNHTLLSLEILRKHNIPIMGLILNGPLHEDNPSTLQEIGKIPIIAQLPTLNKLTAMSLSNEWLKQDLTNKFQTLIQQYSSNHSPL